MTEARGSKARPRQAGAARRRGRPRSFDPEIALERALEAFRRRGFAGTSLDDLTAATGLNRPSLYAAFGNKRALFESCVDHYWAQVSRAWSAALFAEQSLASDLRGLFRAALDTFCGPEIGGCIVVCALPPEAEREPELRDKLSQILASSDRAVSARIAESRDRGESVAGDPDALAALVVSQLLAMSLRARAGAPRERLEAMADELVTLLVPARRVDGSAAT